MQPSVQSSLEIWYSVLFILGLVYVKDLGHLFQYEYLIKSKIYRLLNTTSEIILN